MDVTDPAAGLSRGRDVISFFINGEKHTITRPDTNQTLLTYLREVAGLTGTKEGCAEGDCGACTIVVSERHNGSLCSRAINSCIQLLPTLDGKEITTVEGLRRADGALAPIQAALIESHGSQCGFCTPGFVMSLHAISLSETRPDREAIECALAGNLCRCTGYRPIINAAEHVARQDDTREVAYVQSQRAGCSARLSQTLAGDIVIDVPGRRYWSPTSLQDLAEIRLANPEARLLAGGTDLGLTVTKKRQDLPSLIYVGRVAELRNIVRTADCLEIGAAVALADAFEPLVEAYPTLAEWARRFASPPIRNSGTLGGNIGNGSPIGDSMPVLMAIGASLVLRRGQATREVALDAFYSGYQRNVLAPGEFIERIRVPLRHPGRFVRAYKISKRFDQDISAVCAAFAVELKDGTVKDARIGFGGMAAVPKRASHCEAAVLGRPWNEQTVLAAMDALDSDFQPIDDMRATRGYRRLVARNLLNKCFLETSGSIERISVLAEEVI
ncbi:xanthine dehydrogenase small subunit [Pseudaminobacter sp. NGMCC 1.201702]|uniref:xanthine dehydrogenase small subunit n=1 Tax=Pseudaminobacter sp. NGMCC 1.201702 TaxID=3391825 RepID=UPI0039EF3537